MIAGTEHAFVARRRVTQTLPVSLLLAGGLAAVTGLRMNAQGFQPAWSADRLLVRFAGSLSGTPEVQARIVFGLGALLIAAGLVVLWRLQKPRPLLIIDTDGVESLSGVGKGRLAWGHVTGVRSEGYTITIEGAGDRTITVDARETDRKAADIHAAIHARKPGFSGASGIAGSQA